MEGSASESFLYGDEDAAVTQPAEEGQEVAEGPAALDEDQQELLAFQSSSANLNLDQLHALNNLCEKHQGDDSWIPGASLDMSLAKQVPSVAKEIESFTRELGAKIREAEVRPCVRAPPPPPIVHSNQ